MLPGRWAKTLIDQLSGLAVACALEELISIATIDLRIDYLRAARLGADLYARSECYKITRNVASVRGFAYETDIGDPFAGALGTTRDCSACRWLRATASSSCSVGLPRHYRMRGDSSGTRT